MSAIITANNLGKKYIIKHQGRPAYSTLRDIMTDTARIWGRRIFTRQDGENPEREEFWALKDISFEIAAGERLGIIGHNGAGKSTLLKILSRITEPTSGRVRMKGRVASLLEVGTGFHPELSGRENVYLNGAILGMTRSEIRRKFDEIIDFAEVEKFLDTPVKHYSSGMHVRLAFAVAAHLEPEILIVDEVLAVGDAKFQKKCLGKMEEVGNEGRTVLLVSHNMASLAALCETGIVLSSGAVVFLGGIRGAIDNYLSELSIRKNRVQYDHSGDWDVLIRSISVLDEDRRGVDIFSLAKPVLIQIEYEIPRQLERVQIVCHLWNIHRVHVLATADIDGQPALLEKRMPGRYFAEITVPPHLLGPGVYNVSVACGVSNLRLIDNREGPTFEISALHSYAANWSGARQDVVVALPLTWKTREEAII